MDFREFSEAYNNYLMHRHGVGYNAKRTAKEWNMIKRHAENIKGLDINYLKYRITEADYDKAVDYYMQGENTLGDEILSKYAGVVYHDNFREFSEAYNDYLMHAGTNNGVNIGRLTELLKKYKKQSPPEKHPKIDQLSRIVVQQAQNGNLQQAREVAQEINRITPGSPSSMIFQAIINELTKPQPTYRMADGVPRPR